jgi:hypothetical protein
MIRYRQQDFGKAWALFMEVKDKGGVMATAYYYMGRIKLHAGNDAHAAALLEQFLLLYGVDDATRRHAEELLSELGSRERPDTPDFGG